MKDTPFKVIQNENLTDSVFRMTISGDTSEITAPGQFVNLRLSGLYLRRPISVCDLEGERLTLIYKVVGKGTEKMSELRPGETLMVLTGLGNGYSTEKSGAHPLLIGGGVGVPPLFLLAKRLKVSGAEPSVILGFNTASEVFLENDFAALDIKTFVTTVDGSYGIKGFVTAAMDMAGDYTSTFSCGPEPMLKAVYAASKTDGQYSFEERMGCGFGACMGCTCETKYGHKRICKDGPVLEKGEIKW